MRKPIVWFEIVGQHSDTLHDFYAEVLGWQRDPSHPTVPASRPAPAPAGRRDFPRRVGSSAEPPWWMTFYTCVPDLDSAIQKARELGSRVLVPPTQHGDTTFAVVSDPAGHPVGLCS
jgi:predicted enzyme related to lactoylglutathione lyase